MTTTTGVLTSVKANSAEIDDSGSCVNLNVRVCLRQNWNWHSSERVDVVNRPKIMWEHPINQESAWFGSLFATIFIVALLAGILLVFCVRLTLQTFLRCFTRVQSRSNDGRGPRRTDVMPEGQRTPTQDYVVLHDNN